MCNMRNRPKPDSSIMPGMPAVMWAGTAAAGYERRGGGLYSSVDVAASWWGANMVGPGIGGRCLGGGQYE